VSTDADHSSGILPLFHLTGIEGRLLQPLAWHGVACL
jgi:Cu/Ag efflux pump CusA